MESRRDNWPAVVVDLKAVQAVSNAVVPPLVRCAHEVRGSAPNSTYTPVPTVDFVLPEIATRAAEYNGSAAVEIG